MQRFHLWQQLSRMSANCCLKDTNLTSLEVEDVDENMKIRNKYTSGSMEQKDVEEQKSSMARQVIAETLETLLEDMENVVQEKKGDHDKKAGVKTGTPGVIEASEDSADEMEKKLKLIASSQEITMMDLRINTTTRLTSLECNMTPSIETWLLSSSRQERDTRSSVRVSAQGDDKDQLETAMILLLGLAAEEGLLATQSRLMVGRLRLDLVFTTEEPAAAFCVKVELVQLTLSTLLSLGRLRVEDLGYHLAPVLSEQDLLRIHLLTDKSNCFSTPLLVDIEEKGPGIQARFFSVVDVNLFLETRSSREEERSLGSLKSSSSALSLAREGRKHRYRVRVDRDLPHARRSYSFESEIKSDGVIYFLFRNKPELFHFLFSDIAKNLNILQLVDEDIQENDAVNSPSAKEKLVLSVRVSREMLVQDPSLSSSPRAVPLTSEGHVETSALELLVTGGRVVTALRYRKPGVRSSEWVGCRVEGGKVLAPQGGWGSGEDYVVFVEKRTASLGRKDCTENKSEFDEVRRMVDKLSLNLEDETLARVKLTKKVAELERTVAALKEERMRSPVEKKPSTSGKLRQPTRASSKSGRLHSSSGHSQMPQNLARDLRSGSKRQVGSGFGLF